MEDFISNWWPVITVAAVATGGALAPLLRTLLERLVGFQFDRRMEELRYEVRVREQAAKTAEYLATAWQLEATDDKQVYRRANQLVWELALYLPHEVFLQVRDAVRVNDSDRNVFTALMAVRKHLLGQEAGDLVADDLSLHSPNAQSSLGTAPEKTPDDN